MTHEYDSCFAVVVFRGGIGDCRYYSAVVVIACKKRSAYLYAVELVSLRLYDFHKIVVLISAHNVCGLYDKLLYAVLFKALERFVNIVDLDTVTLFQLVDDDLAGECAAHFLIGVRVRDSFFYRADSCVTAVIVACSEAYRKNNGLCVSGCVFSLRLLLVCLYSFGLLYCCLCCRSRFRRFRSGSCRSLRCAAAACH